ncbi:MAG: hypothetical protein D6743_15290 [Calditrichaeota bacterium]|nr:MAG: hypothetical protein D6743_15290 [Calditrichota bacterium]
MFARRNSVTLAVIWIILLIAGAFWYFRDSNKLMEVLNQKKTYEQKLAKSQELIKKLTEVENVHELVSELWENSPKRIISAEEPSFTLAYINDIALANNLQIDFDFALNNRKKLKDYTRFTYTLSGEGRYDDIYRLIWLLTYEPILYKIRSLSLRPAPSAPERLRFAMQLQGFTVEKASEGEKEFADFHAVRRTNIPRQPDIFAPQITRRPVAVRSVQKAPKLPPKLPGQIDVEKASLKAVTSNSIFISEGGSGLVELKVGDPVYLGRLVAIDQNTNEAEFIITKFGKSQRIKLKIDERK